ncbi:MAG: magnesium transporter [Abditibacteriota bacterium]|nr:magnesium transporter [Abditibacteriota bacterium]
MYLSYVIGKQIKTADGANFGRLVDLIASPSPHLPIISAVKVKVPGKSVRTLARRCFGYDEKTERFALNCPTELLEDYEADENDILLAHSVMDKQIVDVHDYRVVRVNDVRIEPSGRSLYLVGVDVGVRGLLRRMGLMHASDALSKVTHIRPSSQVIAWDDVETFKNGKLKLSVSAGRLSALHPSDIARIVNDLDPAQRTDVFEMLDLETAADVLTETTPEVQADILENLEEERAADILEEMEPDEAADVLGDISESKREDILVEMEPEEAEDVKELLSYPDDSAGGLMTTEYVALPKDMTAARTVEYLREHEDEAEVLYYLYIVDSSGRMLGVTSLRDLIMADPKSKLEDFMIKKVISVNTDDEIDDVVRALSDYNLIAVPVLDESDVLRGVITVDDVLEELVPEEWRDRMPKVWRG